MGLGESVALPKGTRNMRHSRYELGSESPVDILVVLQSETQGGQMLRDTRTLE